MTPETGQGECTASYQCLFLMLSLFPNYVQCDYLRKLDEASSTPMLSISPLGCLFSQLWASLR